MAAQSFRDGDRFLGDLAVQDPVRAELGLGRVPRRGQHVVGLRRFVNVYLNDEDVRFLSGLETPVKDGDTVTVLPAVAGGAF